uniref:Uncharacterized protein n=1 Tax=Nelumbo nucifera TaxID=4432 RepID=A0A822ZN67_NELNU|nr:TPA_asm: hypothetical protein HUJ06_017381 [Nelumbo nucifera]
MGIQVRGFGGLWAAWGGLLGILSNRCQSMIASIRKPTVVLLSPPPYRSAIGHHCSPISSPTPQFQNPPPVTNGSPTTVLVLQVTTTPTLHERTALLPFCRRMLVASPTLRKRSVQNDNANANKQRSSASDEQEDADVLYIALPVLVTSNGRNGPVLTDSNDDSEDGSGGWICRCTDPCTGLLSLVSGYSETAIQADPNKLLPPQDPHAHQSTDAI